MDGDLCSSTNADLAVGYASVVIVTPTGDGSPLTAGGPHALERAFLVAAANAGLRHAALLADEHRAQSGRGLPLHPRRARSAPSLAGVRHVDGGIRAEQAVNFRDGRAHARVALRQTPASHDLSYTRRIRDDLSHREHVYLRL